VKHQLREGCNLTGVCSFFRCRRWLNMWPCVSMGTALGLGTLRETATRGRKAATREMENNWLCQSMRTKLILSGLNNKQCCRLAKKHWHGRCIHTYRGMSNKVSLNGGEPRSQNETLETMSWRYKPAISKLRSPWSPRSFSRGSVENFCKDVFNFTEFLTK
jgi:hypothetical protein